MPRIVFAPAIQRHVAMPALDVGAATVAAALQAAFAREPRLRGYLLDDQAVCAGMWRCSSMACRSAIAGDWAIRSKTIARSTWCRR